MPSISVVMSVFNTDTNYLFQAVNSILNQSFRDIEFIIIDDHSTLYNVKSILSSIRDSRLRIYRNSRNLGLTKSLNIGIKVSRANLIARMDSDDISNTDRLYRQYVYLNENPRYSLIGSDAYIIDRYSKVIRIKKRITDHNGISFYSFINNPFMHSSVLFRKDHFYEVGGYDEGLKYAQDYDLWCKFIEKYKCCNIPLTLVSWRDNPSSISRTKCTEQTKNADNIVLAHFRRMFPNLSNIEDKHILSIRHNRFNKNNIELVDKIVKTILNEFKSKYTNNWYKEYLDKTKIIRVLR